MSDSSYKTAKTPISELCKDALEHYLKLSDEACHYNSLIPEALAVYQRVREHYDTLNETWESWTWQRRFEIGTATELNQLEEFLGFDSSHSTKEVLVQIPNTDGNDRTDIVKSSQLGFEVPEV